MMYTNTPSLTSISVVMFLTQAVNVIAAQHNQDLQPGWSCTFVLESDTAPFSGRCQGAFTIIFQNNLK